MSKQNRTIIFLDFDGVLCDSVKEAYILARFAYKNIDVKIPVEKDFYQIFLKFRYLVSNSWQYYFLMQILDEIPSEDVESIEEKFNSLTSNGKTELSNEFNKKFLGKRQDLMKSDFDFWNNLETQTPFLSKLKSILQTSNKSKFAILSTKNKDAIIAKFKYWNVEFNTDLIFDKKDLENLTKGEFIEKYMTENNVPSAILIDDNEDNINSCSGIENLSACLTGWGYTKFQNGYTEEQVIEIIKENL